MSFFKELFPFGFKDFRKPSAQENRYHNTLALQKSVEVQHLDFIRYNAKILGIDVDIYVSSKEVDVQKNLRIESKIKYSFSKNFKETRVAIENILRKLNALKKLYRSEKPPESIKEVFIDLWIQELGKLFLQELDAKVLLFGDEVVVNNKSATTETQILL